MSRSALQDDAAVAAGAVSVTALAWRFQGVVRVTAVAKATFAFASDAQMPRVAPDPIVHAEVHHGNSPTQSIRLTTDRVPYLTRADVLLTGSAHAPRGTLLETLPVRLGLFDAEHTQPVLDKTVIVRKPGGFKDVPLVYEHAYGGIGFPDNPFGQGAAPGSGEPTLVDLLDAKRVAGFGPIGQAWPARKRLLGTLPRRALDAEGIIDLPDAFDWAYFQAAPADQRIPFLRGDEWIVMDGMHPKSPRLRVRLPGARGLGLVYGLGPWGVAEGQPIALHADMLRIDTGEERCTVSFRATFPVPGEAALEAVRVVLGVELPGQPIAWPDPASLAVRAAATSPPSSGIPISMEDFESVHGEVLMGTMSEDAFDVPRRAKPLPALEHTLSSELAAPAQTGVSRPKPGPVLPFHEPVGPSALRQGSGRRRHEDNPLSGTIAQTPEESELAAHRRALPFGEKEPLAPPPPPAPPPPSPGPEGDARHHPPAVEKREAASLWAPPAPAPAPPVAQPPAPQGPPAASPALKKGLYGRFGGKH